MITSLTKEQEDLLPVYRDKWISIGLNTEPANKNAAEAGIKRAYEIAGLTPPTIEWFDSPQAVVREKKIQVESVFYGQFEAGWLSFYNYVHEVLKIDCSKLEGLMQIAQNCSWVWLYDTHAFAVDRPKSIKRNARHQLHSESGPAFEWRDGTKLYFWNGVRVPEQLIVDPDHFDVKRALTETNLEVRRAITEKLTWTRVLECLKYKTIQRDDYGELIETQIEGAPARFVRVKDYSTERQYVICVPPATRSAHEGVASLWGMKQDEFSPTQRT